MTIIEVPGETTLFRSHDVPPDRVEFPLEPRVSVGWCPSWRSSRWCPPSSPRWRSGSWYPGFAADALAILLIMGFVAVCFWAAILTAIADVLRWQPIPILGADGLIDRRSSEELVLWSEVAQARFAHIADLR
jgi:hypothetical protein